MYIVLFTCIVFFFVLEREPVSYEIYIYFKNSKYLYIGMMYCYKLTKQNFDVILYINVKCT